MPKSSQLINTNLKLGNICDVLGESLPAGSSPPPFNNVADGYSPFGDRLEFEFADFIYRRDQMSGANTNILLDIWEANTLKLGGEASFHKHKDIYSMIDSIPHGDVPWNSFLLYYQGERPEEGPVPSWMDAEYDVWSRDPRKLLHNLISNPDFKDKFNYFPYHEYIDGKHTFQDFMSGDWVWRQAVQILFYCMTCQLR